MRTWLPLLTLLVCTSIWTPALASAALTGGGAHRLEANAVVIDQAPAWLKQVQLEKVIDRVQDALEWDIRKINVTWYSDQVAFQKVHGFGPTVLAFARRQDNTIHVGPRVDGTQFEGVFGHELAHIVIFQKYKAAVPSWLDEGLANYAAKRGVVDYAWLAKHPPAHVRALTHPFLAAEKEEGISSSELPQYRYMVSTALVKFIGSKCEISQLLQLALGKSVENYLPTFCEVKDLDTEFKAYLNAQAHGKPPASTATHP